MPIYIISHLPVRVKIGGCLKIKGGVTVLGGQFGRHFHLPEINEKLIGKICWCLMQQLKFLLPFSYAIKQVKPWMSCSQNMISAL